MVYNSLFLRLSHARLLDLKQSESLLKSANAKKRKRQQKLSVLGLKQKDSPLSRLSVSARKQQQQKLRESLPKKKQSGLEHYLQLERLRLKN